MTAAVVSHDVSVDLRDVGGGERRDPERFEEQNLGKCEHSFSLPGRKGLSR